LVPFEGTSKNGPSRKGGDSLGKSVEKKGQSVANYGFEQRKRKRGKLRWTGDPERKNRLRAGLKKDHPYHFLGGLGREKKEERITINAGRPGVFFGGVFQFVCEGPTGKKKEKRGSPPTQRKRGFHPPLKKGTPLVKRLECCPGQGKGRSAIIAEWGRKLVNTRSRGRKKLG